MAEKLKNSNKTESVKIPRIPADYYSTVCKCGVCFSPQILASDRRQLWCGRDLALWQALTQTNTLKPMGLNRI